MTKISYIHGIGKDELPQRGKQAPLLPQYLNYGAMTQGEFKLALLREQAMVYARAYPEVKSFHKAVQMYDKALGDLSGQQAFVGVIEDDLQAVARQIRNAKKYTAPAAGAFYAPRAVNGFRIGADPIIPYSIQEDCLEYATRMANKFYNQDWSTKRYMEAPLLGIIGAKRKRWVSLVEACKAQQTIEKVYNDKLEQASHHVLYVNFSTEFKPIIGSRVDVKRLLHSAGTTAMASAATLNKELMKMWVETGVLRSNATGGVGAMGSVQASFLLAENGSELWKQYQAAKTGKTAGSGINVDPVITPLVIKLVITAITAASAIAVAAINAKQTQAFQAAAGFGTPAYSAEKSDWLDVNQDGIPDTPTQQGQNNNMLPLLLLGGGAYLLFSK